MGLNAYHSIDSILSGKICSVTPYESSVEFADNLRVNHSGLSAVEDNTKLIEEGRYRSYI